MTHFTLHYFSQDHNEETLMFSSWKDGGQGSLCILGHGLDALASVFPGTGVKL